MPELNPIKRPETWKPDPRFMSLMFGKGVPQPEELSPAETEKINLFEKELAKELNTTDTIQQAVTKIVRIALAAEFGPSLLTAPGSRQMVETIIRGIMDDPILRKQALIIIDRFAKEPLLGEG